MNEHAVAVYDLIRDNPRTTRFAPLPSEACQALGMTRREYIRALKWLIEHHFLGRSTYERTWKAVFVAHRYCRCGAELTPNNAIVENSRGTEVVRRICRTCRRSQWADASRRRRETTDNAAYQKKRRLRRVMQQRSASP